MIRLLIPSFRVAVLLLAAAWPADAGVVLRIEGEIDSTKTLFVHAYSGNGHIEAKDFLESDTLVGSVDLVAGDDEFTPVVLEFDITDFVSSLSGGADHIGFNLRESQSSGSILVTEILILGSVETLSQVVGVATLRSALNAELELLSLSIGPPPHYVYYSSRSIESRVAVEFKIAPASLAPEPGTAVLAGLACVCSWLARGKRRSCSWRRRSGSPSSDQSGLMA